MRGWFSGPGIGVLDTRYVNVPGDTMTGALMIDGSADVVQLLVQADAGQTVNIQEWQDSGGNVVAGLDERGVPFCDLNTDPTNMFFGLDAGNTTMTGDDNVFFGNATGVNITSGYRNIGIGAWALTTATTGHRNVAIGWNALTRLTTAQSNFGLGYNAGQRITSGGGNVAIGVEALQNVTTNQSNTAIGGNTLDKCTGGFNVGISKEACRFGTNIHRNIFIGYQAAKGVNGSTIFNEAVIIGNEAAFSVTTGGQRATIIGYKAGYAITTGNHNILLGYQAGDVLTTGASNIIIGYDVDPTALGVSSELNIGALLYGDLANNMGGVNVTPPSLAAAWHVDQAASDAAIPVLYLDQADVDQEMIEFATTIGVGNAIEAVGGKVLTTTHFIKISIPGGLTRYIPCGTIA